MSERTVAEERDALAAVARELGDLLLVELDAPRLARLRGLGDALSAVGVELPPEGADLDLLAAGFHAAFVQPTGGGAPPVASLWTEGRYEGAAAARVRELARSAAVDHDPAAARGAPVDHLGCVLHLWAATAERAPWVSAELGERWLDWADAPLARVEEAGGFYGGVARAARGLVATLAAAPGID